MCSINGFGQSIHVHVVYTYDIHMSPTYKILNLVIPRLNKQVTQSKRMRQQVVLTRYQVARKRIHVVITI